MKTILEQGADPFKLNTGNRNNGTDPFKLNDGSNSSTDPFKLNPTPAPTNPPPATPNVFACVEAAHTSGKSYNTGSTQLTITRSGGSKHIFKNDYAFTYQGTGSNTGTWACDGTNNYKITLTNGQTYSSKDHKWSPVPQTPPPTPAPTTGGGTTPTTLTPDDLINGKFVKLGMRGDIIGKIQELLISKGYKDISKDGKVDKIFGRRTKKMVKDFQSANNLKDDGAVGELTWGKLNDSSAVSASASTSTSTSSSSSTGTQKNSYVSGSDAIIY
jgi:hypothetical protein